MYSYVVLTKRISGVSELETNFDDGTAIGWMFPGFSFYEAKPSLQCGKT